MTLKHVQIDVAEVTEELPRAFCLLYLGAASTSANMRRSEQTDQPDIYLLNAVLLAKTLASEGVRLTMITNDSLMVTKRLVHFGIPLSILSIVQHTFSLSVPIGIPFFAAHYKLDVFKFLSQQPPRYYCILLDLDMLALPGLKLALKPYVRLGLPLAYNISSQVYHTAGTGRVVSDLERLAGEQTSGEWWGGEFIGGQPYFFGELYAQIMKLWPDYCINWKTLHHNGDEMLTSVALNRLTLMMKVVDAGALGLVYRYWSGLVGHPQCSTRDVYNRGGLLHLPQDKGQLAKVSKRYSNVKELSALDPEFLRVMRRYFWYRSVRRIAQKIRLLLLRT